MKEAPMASGWEAIGPWVWRLAPLVVLVVGGWLLVRSATRMPGESYRGSLAPLTEHENEIRDEVRAHVAKLAGEIGPRGLHRYDALLAAEQYLRAAFEEMGYAVREQAFEVDGYTVKNLEVELPGRSLPEEVVLIGAHYDSVPATPGANDNASGVAALVALARRAKPQRFARTVRFVAFVNEEPPYFTTGRMGSRVYSREARQRGDRIMAMFSLETIGYYSDRAGSQMYPFPIHFSYPNTGNFIGFVGNYSSRALVRRAVDAFRRGVQFPSEGVAAPGFIPGIGWSDHWSFWEEGYPGVMVTDTALYRYPQYHTPLDTPEILDYERLARVVAGLEHVLAVLASPH